MSAIAALRRASYGLVRTVTGRAMSILDDHDQRQSSDAFDRSREGRASAIRNLMIGRWAASLMGLKDADAYGRAVARPGSELPPEEDVLRKVSRDLADSGLAVSITEVRAKMDEFLAQARAQLEIDDRA